VGVGEGLADIDESPQEAAQFQNVVASFAAALVETRDSRPECLAAHQAHRVEGPLSLGPAGQFIDRHDVGVLKLAGHLRLFEEAALGFGS
jgi:hypothetical protein